MKNLNIGPRLYLGFGMLLCLMLCGVMFALLQMKALMDSTQQITATWLPSVEVAKQMGVSANAIRVFDGQYILNSDAEARKEVDKDMGSAVAKFNAARASYLAFAKGEEENALALNFATAWDKYHATRDEIITAAKLNEADRAMKILEGPSKEAFDEAQALLAKLLAVNFAGAQRHVAASEGIYVSARNLLLAGLLLAVVLGIACAAMITKSITSPLALALRFANRVSEGDLSEAMQASASDELGQLMASMAAMRDNLVAVVAAVRAGSEGVAVASSEIAQGNLDLSVRTEEQATALEHTTSSMLDLDRTVKDNAAHASEANSLAAGAVAVASEGGRLISEVVETMREITTSSKKISEITQVIDGIAFQTNILALNAAVEAARAGAHGRGFAVVASEVRKLAGRSAEASREIKQLITEGVEKINQGSSQAEGAGSTMNEVVKAIDRVARTMSDISDASRDQSSRFSHVGEAISQIDRVTQQNAALVEEISAAASSLKVQAVDLVRTVAIFKIRDGTTRDSTIRGTGHAVPRVASYAGSPTLSLTGLRG